MHWSLPNRGGMRRVGTSPWEFAACPPGARGARMLAPHGRQGTSPAWHLLATGSPKCPPSTRPSPLTLARLFLGCWPWGTGDAQPSHMGWEDGVGQAAGRRPELHMGFAVMTAPL